MFRALAVLALMSLAGCPRTADKPSSNEAKCTRVGQRCLHSPGKLGVCGPAGPDSCDEPPCFDCVDQH
jgi:hypothetical protein